eukprot:1668751-Prymnesium_polylepis.1
MHARKSASRSAGEPAPPALIFITRPCSASMPRTRSAHSPERSSLTSLEPRAPSRYSSTSAAVAPPVRSMMKSPSSGAT